MMFAYGKGPMPVICATISLSDEKYWRKERKDIWVCDRFDTLEICNIVFEDGNSFGALRWSPEEMADPGDFYSNGFGETVAGFSC